MTRRTESVLRKCLALFDKGHAIDRFNWGASALTGDNIRELNELPGKIREALEETEMWIGKVDIDTSRGNTILIVSNSPQEAGQALFAAWKKEMYPGFAEEKDIRSFADLHEWNGARIVSVPFDEAFIWEQL